MCDAILPAPIATMVGRLGIFLFDAIEKINSKGKEAIVSFAEGAQMKGMIAGLKQYTKYQNYPNVVALRRNIATTLIEENKYPF